MLHRNTLTFFALTALTSGTAQAEVDFVKDVRPILEKHCYECHGETKQKSGLRLDIKASAFHQGDVTAPNIIAGQADKSPIIEYVTASEPDERMPPKGPGLSPTEITTLTDWINGGAIWPDGVDHAQLEDRLDHWSFKPLQDYAPPQLTASTWARNDIDRFILSQLQKTGLSPSSESDRASWLRRVYFDLSGLPPTLAQADAFIQDQRPDAYERVVEDLLQSPRYGERWAQHWLDVVRYADTHGFEVNTERPNAWPYRDYVIRAFNQDTPYDRFIREQLVGDAMGEDAATGFLVTASVLLPAQIGKDEPSKRLARQDAIDEIVTNISQTFLGLSVSCARCHDHKFDPVSAKDYYSLQAFVAGVDYLDRPLRTPDAQAAREESAKLKKDLVAIERQLVSLSPLVGSGVQRPRVNSRENVDRFTPVTAKRIRFTIRTSNSLEPCIDELEVFEVGGANVALASAGAVASSSSDYIVADRHDLKYLNDGAYGNNRSWVSGEKGTGWVVVEFPAEQKIERVVWGRDRKGSFTDRVPVDYTIEISSDSNGRSWQTVATSEDRHPFDPKAKAPPAFSTEGLSPEESQFARKLLSEKKSLEATLLAANNRQNVFGGRFRQPDVIHLLSRGDPEQPKEEIAPATLSAFGAQILEPSTPEQQRRRTLADWIASPENPLTARVMVNRIWQGHFGTGLVDTPSDFGRMGSKPSHPELLDWLAAEFMRGGWSIKHLHRLIVLSATYRQASGINPVAQAKDADARLLWRYPNRRLDAESIRDTILAVSDRLNLTMYGRGFDLFDKRGGLTGFQPVESPQGEALRRMIYSHKVRREREAVFGAFDCPDAGQSTARRRESTTPLQALNLFNSQFTLDQAQAFATSIARDAGPNAAKQVELAYQRVLGRAPREDEFTEALITTETHGLAPLGRALFNSNEFLYPP